MAVTNRQDRRAETIDCLKHALQDTQETIRAYDIKAQSLGVLLTVSIGVVNFGIAATPFLLLKILAIFASVAGLAAIWLLGQVLHPRNEPWKRIQLGTYQPAHTYYLLKPEEQGSLPVSSQSERAVQTDWVAELTYELMKVSAIRNAKHRWLLWSLRTSAVSFAAVIGLLLGSVLVGTEPAPPTGATPSAAAIKPADVAPPNTKQMSPPAPGGKPSRTDTQ